MRRANHRSDVCCGVCAAAVLVLSCGLAEARPYGVRIWEQRHDNAYDADFTGVLTDLFKPDGVTQLTYDQLHTVGNTNKIYRGLGNDAWKVMDWSTVPKDSTDPTKPDYTKVADFTLADFEEFRDGGWHCVPTSAAMAHDYWWNNALSEVQTIRDFASPMDTGDANAAMNAGDHQTHYFTYWVDAPTAIKSKAPGAPWAGNYESARSGFGGGGPNDAQKHLIYGEIRAGRPIMIGTRGHAMMGVDYDAGGVRVNDPWDGVTEYHAWAALANGHAITQQPHKLADLALPAGQVYFSNDNFGTGQANAQAPAGDSGDIFLTDLGGTYGRAWDDINAGVAADYNNSGNVTNGNESQFDMDGLDILHTIQEMAYLTFSIDHGDPNPHDWIPGVAEGGPSYQPLELDSIYLPTEFYTAGTVIGATAPVGANENGMGLNRGEWALPGDPLDDDVDALDIDVVLSVNAFTLDFADTRVFPELTVNAGANWHETGWDPTDIFFSDGGIIDGETVIMLSEHTDLDAIQLVSFSELGTVDALLFSVDGDAPEMEDAFGAPMTPGDIYLSHLDGTAPILYLPLFGYAADLDAITWSVPAPGTLVLIGLGAAMVRRREA